MMLKSKGRAALLTCASLVAGLGLSSCGTSTIGYLYVTSVQFGQALSFRININNGKIGGTNCSVANAGQQTCQNSSGGANPTKLVLADGNQYMYVLNQGSTSPPSAGNVGLLTLGGSGSVYSTGQTYSTPQAGQNPVDMYLGPSATFLYVLYQYQPATVPGCANPTPSTCQGSIGLYSIGSNGTLTIQPNANQPSIYYFPVGYVPDAPDYILGFSGSHMYAASGILYLLDNNSSDKPQVDSYALNSTNGQLTNSQNVATQNSAFGDPVWITGYGTYVFIADSLNGAIWTYTIGSSNGALTGAGNGYFCPANPSYVYTQGGEPTQAQCATATANTPPFAHFDALLVNTGGSNTYLYAADNNTSQIYAMTFPTGGSGILSLSSGGPNPVGTSATNPSCMTASTSLPFLYVSGNGTLFGEQINTSTGVLTTQNNAVTTAALQGYAPCLMFSSRK
jgi:hypothetical protein